MVRRVAIVGASGSIGRQALEVVRANPGRLAVAGLAADRDDGFLVQAAMEFGAPLVALRDAAAAERASRRLAAEGRRGVRVLSGEEGVRAVASDEAADVVLSAAWGAAGLGATLAALEAGRNVALANKESLVAGGELVMAAKRASGARLLPVDSEHSAAFQLIAGLGREPERAGLRRLWITASGGPFRGRTREAMAEAPPEEALRHPSWTMGRRITVDSATLFNKGLEVIEAHWLFGLPYDAIEVVVHPQSRVHAILELADGSFLAHAGAPDMRVPIQYALSFPERWDPPADAPPPPEWGTLTFEPVDRRAFPALDLCCRAGRAGGTAPAVLNAAKEEAVLAYLDGRIPFGAMAELVEEALEAAGVLVGRGAGGPAAPAGGSRPQLTLDDVVAADRAAREWTRRRIAALAGGGAAAAGYAEPGGETSPPRDGARRGRP